MADDIYSVVEYSGHWEPEYFDKYVHPIPEAKVVDRHSLILDHCKGQSVVNFGSASGVLHERIKKVARALFGVDKEQPADYVVDLDDEFYRLTGNLPPADVYVVGEIIEHLSNPGMFLKRLKKAMEMHGGPTAYAIITVPNALSDVLRKNAQRGFENVNSDHVAFYTWKTLKVLVERAGFSVRQFWYYRGEPIFAEGLIFLVK